MANANINVRIYLGYKEDKATTLKELMQTTKPRFDRFVQIDKKSNGK